MSYMLDNFFQIAHSKYIAFLYLINRQKKEDSKSSKTRHFSISPAVSHPPILPKQNLHLQPQPTSLLTSRIAIPQRPNPTTLNATTPHLLPQIQ
jgi:hypothetical protein